MLGRIHGAGVGRVELLGRPRAHTSRGVVDFVADQRFQLLAYLAYEGGWVTRERASFLFWPDVPSESARTNLRQLLMRVRQLEWLSGLEVDRQRLRWRVETDVAGLKQVAASSQPDAEWSEYRGPLLQDLEGEDAGEFASWLELERELVSGLWRGGVLERAREFTEQGRHGEAAELYRRLLEQDELDEDALQAYMRAAFEAGHKELALQRYRGFAKRLEKELGLSPSSVSEQLAERIRQSAQATLVESRQAPQVATAVREARSLPSAPTSFVGRELELSEIAHLLGKPDCRLLTVTGLGGVGKTRLALKAVEELSQSYRDGVYWVALESLSSASYIATAMAAGLGVRLQGEEDPLAQIVRYLKSRQVLLVLDNFEHLLEGVPVVSHLTAQCPQVKLLVTSREALNLEEEWRLPLEGLAVPAGDTITEEEASSLDAVQLFCERAQRVQPRFNLSGRELPEVLTICRLTGGFPLAIELAAAWAKMMSAREIAKQIEQSLDFLSAPRRNASDRHKSIRATFEQSWSLLTPTEQRVLGQLSVFRGGFRLEAARYVAGAPLPILSSLLDKSLLRVAAEDRYDRHPLLHGYTKEKLSEHPEEERQTQEKHLRYYVDLAERAEPELAGPEQASWLQRLGAEHDNLRAALEYAGTSSRGETGLSLAGALWAFWFVRGDIIEGREHLTTALSIDGAERPTKARAQALNCAGGMALMQSDYATARALHEESLAISRQLREKVYIAASLHNLGMLAYQEADYSSARRLYEEGLAIQQELGNRLAIGALLSNLGILAEEQGEYSLARSLHQQSLAISREFGNQLGVASSLLGLGAVAYREGDYASARELLEESIAIGRRLEYKSSIAASLNYLGLLAEKQGDYASARELLEGSMAMGRELGHKLRVAVSLESFARLAAATGEPGRAARLWGAGEGLRVRIGAPLPPSRRAEYEQSVASARGQLEEDEFTAAWNDGREMSLELAVAYALEERGPSA